MGRLCIKSLFIWHFKKISIECKKQRLPLSQNWPDKSVKIKIEIHVTRVYYVTSVLFIPSGSTASYISVQIVEHYLYEGWKKPNRHKNCLNAISFNFSKRKIEVSQKWKKIKSISCVASKINLSTSILIFPYYQVLLSQPLWILFVFNFSLYDLTWPL